MFAGCDKHEEKNRSKLSTFNEEILVLQLRINIDVEDLGRTLLILFMPMKS